MSKEYTRREVAGLKPSIKAKYWEFVYRNDLSGLQEFMDKYNPEMDEDERAEVIREFTHLAEIVLRRNWRVSPKRH
jgi:hypothetical protein